MKKLPKKNHPYCLNCHYPLPESARFCHKCSQKVTDGRVTFREMIGEFIGTVFNWDSRFFQTIGALFVPGKLTAEYFKGRHRRYVHPLRLFLVMTIAMVAAITFTMDEEDNDFLDMGHQYSESKISVAHYDWLMELDSLKTATTQKFNNEKVTEAMDTLFQKVLHGKEKIEKDSVELNKMNLGFSTLKKVATKDIIELKTNEILDKYEETDFWGRLEAGQKIRVLKKGGSFIGFMIGNISWMLFFMMPLLALILKLLYLRRSYFYVEHLVFSFHVHAFVFFMFISMLLLNKYVITEDWMFSVGFLIIAVYFYFAMWQFYKQGKFKTLVKYFLMGLLYFVILIFAVVATLIVSFALF